MAIARSRNERPLASDFNQGSGAGIDRKYADVLAQQEQVEREIGNISGAAEKIRADVQHVSQVVQRTTDKLERAPKEKRRHGKARRSGIDLQATRRFLGYDVGPGRRM